MTVSIIKVRTADDIAQVRKMVWEFFDFLRHRYPEMIGEIDSYIETKNVAGELQDFGSFFLPPKGECFMGLLAGAPVGIVMLKQNANKEGEMNRMYVRDTARGHGVGRQLGQALVNEAKALNYSVIRLDGLHRHVEALPLYEKLGFEYYTDETVYGGRDDKRFIHMRMPL